MKLFRPDYIFYLIIILISLIPLYFIRPGDLSIYYLRINDKGSISLWRGDTGASGYFDFKPVERVEKVVKYNFAPEGRAPSSLNSNPILYKDTVYIGFKDRIVALDFGKMKERWNVKISITPKTSFTLIDHYLFFPSRRGVIGIDIESKRIAFEYNFKREVVKTPINYKDGVIYFGTQYFFWHGFQSNEPLHVVMNGFDLNKKRFIFRYKVINQRKISYPVIDGNTLIFTTNNSIFALDLNSGRERWRINSKSFCLSEPPLIRDGICYYYENWMDSSVLHAVNVKTGKDVWKHDFKTQLTNTLCIDDKDIYFSTQDGVLYSLNRFNGDTNWIKENFKIFPKSLIVVKNMLYFVKDNSLFALNKNDGELIWIRKDRIENPIFSPLASDGVIIVPHFFELYIYEG